MSSTTSPPPSLPTPTSSGRPSIGARPRNAIVECWLRLEAAVIAAGVERAPSDTSAELTERVLASCQVDGAAISTLAALYREARFSEHPMGEESRRSAIDALGVVHHSLRADVGPRVVS